MRTIKIILKTCLYLFIVFSFLQCSTKNPSECKSKKIQLLLENILRKESFLIVREPLPLDSIDKSFMEPDSSMYFYYLYSTNIKIPDKEFYSHLYKYDSIDSTYPDSVKLRILSDSRNQYLYSPVIGIHLLEVNEDTTKLKIELNFGASKRAFYDRTFTYSFDEKNCKWVVLDSTITYY
jgi:hypothetical protein